MEECALSIVLTGNTLTLAQLYAIARMNEPVEIHPDAARRLEESRQLVFDLVESDVPVYGFNTGVGWNKDKHIAADFFKEYNENVIHSHSLGVAPEASREEVRAAMAIRLNCLLRGNTGIQPAIARRYAEFLNLGITPAVPQRGSVGESDIAVLSHIGLAMIGEGDADYDGTRMTSARAHAETGLQPVELGPKDALAIVNSSAFGMAQGAMVLCDLLDLVDQADLIYAVSLEGLNGNTSPLEPKVHEARHLQGQAKSAALVNRFLEESFIFSPDPEKPVQDPLCFRGGAYVHGSLRDALEYVVEKSLVQMNCSDDNPCLLLDERRIVSCSNFETTTLAAGFEMLSVVLSHVSRMSCYRMIKLGNPAFTGLTRFLTPAEGKVHAFGTIQKTFSLLDTEIRHLSNPSTVDYLSLAGDIEDHANNLPHIAQRVRKIADNLKYILGMEMMHAAQAVSLRKQAAPGLPLGKGTAAAYEEFRKAIPWLDRDRTLSTDIGKAYGVVNEGGMLRTALSASARA